MSTHITHYATQIEFAGRTDRIVGYAVYNILKSKYLSPKGGYTCSKSRADIFTSRQLIKSVFPESFIFAEPIFQSDNNYLAARGWGIKYA